LHIAASVRNGWPRRAGARCCRPAGACLDVERHARDLELHALEFGDRLAELLALLDVAIV
jgi:hypothetical protein